MCTGLYASSLGIIYFSVRCFHCILQESKLVAYKNFASNNIPDKATRLLQLHPSMFVYK